MGAGLGHMRVEPTTTRLLFRGEVVLMLILGASCAVLTVAGVVGLATGGDSVRDSLMNLVLACVGAFWSKVAWRDIQRQLPRFADPRYSSARQREDFDNAKDCGRSDDRDPSSYLGRRSRRGPVPDGTEPLVMVTGSPEASSRHTASRRVRARRSPRWTPRAWSGPRRRVVSGNAKDCGCQNDHNPSSCLAVGFCQWVNFSVSPCRPTQRREEAVVRRRSR